MLGAERKVVDHGGLLHGNATMRKGSGCWLAFASAVGEQPDGSESAEAGRCDPIAACSHPRSTRQVVRASLVFQSRSEWRQCRRRISR
jgi:hypothetical protein